MSIGSSARQHAGHNMQASSTGRRTSASWVGHELTRAQRILRSAGARTHQGQAPGTRCVSACECVSWPRCSAHRGLGCGTLIQGGSPSDRPMHDQRVKKIFVAAVRLSAIALQAAAFLVHEFVASGEDTTVVSECPAEAQMCDPLQPESTPVGASLLASKGDTRIERWAVLLLELCAAGWVLLHLAREAQTVRGVRFYRRSTVPRSELEGTASEFRTF